MKYSKLSFSAISFAIQEFVDQPNEVQLVVAVKLLVVNVIEHLVEVTIDCDTEIFNQKLILIKKRKG